MKLQSIIAVFVFLILYSSTFAKISRHCLSLKNIKLTQSVAWQAKPLRQVFDQSNLIIEKDYLGITKQIMWASGDSISKGVNIKRILIGDREDEIQVRNYIDALHKLIDEPDIVRFVACAEGVAVKPEVKRYSNKRKFYGDQIRVVYLITEPFIANFDENTTYQSLLPYFRTKSEAYRVRVYARMASLLNNLHSIGIIHGGVQPHNFKTTSLMMSHVQIDGFENSGQLNDPFRGKSSIFNARILENDFPVLTQQLDVYGFGMTIAAMEISQHLIAKVANNLSRKSRDEYLSKLQKFVFFNLNRIKNFRKTLQFKDSLSLIVNDCLSPNPVERPSMKSVVERLTNITKLVKFKPQSKAQSTTETKIEIQALGGVQAEQETVEESESKTTDIESHNEPVESALFTIQEEKDDNQIKL